MTSSEKNTATLTHLSSLAQYVIPFGNYIFPSILWSSKKDSSEFVDFHGKQTLNFQLSIFLYSLLLGLVSIVALVFMILNGISIDTFDKCEFIINNVSQGNISTMVVLVILCLVLYFFLKVLQFILTIYGAVKASNGEYYKYPLTINFLK